MKVTALAGGVGGAKLAHGLAQVLPHGDLTVVVNTGDDFEHLGLHVSPDLDTVMYTLAGMASQETGWGIAGDTWSFLEATGRLGGEIWFRIGDRDLATHVERTRRMRAGETLTDVTAAFCRSLAVRVRVLPMTDDTLRTLVQTEYGWLDFQDYFVRRQCQPRVSGFRFDGLERARPTGPVLAALDEADMVVFCPSNPFVSVDPILSLPGMRLRVTRKPAVAVSPIVGGKALKGPAAKMLAELNLPVNAAAVARHYAGLIGSYVVDTVDAGLTAEIQAAGMQVLVAHTVMQSDADRATLAEEVLRFMLPGYAGRPN